MMSPQRAACSPYLRPRSRSRRALLSKPRAPVRSVEQIEIGVKPIEAADLPERVAENGARHGNEPPGPRPAVRGIVGRLPDVRRLTPPRAYRRVTATLLGALGRSFLAGGVVAAAPQPVIHRRGLRQLNRRYQCTIKGDDLERP